ncbi:RICIN domain-containing protein [Streptomyces cellulosae]|uniref:RICIN domain-containing protein n=1 Tax=Streptomyces cellulosae TaxID=1968 RepID=A0ABW7YLE8_STRCE
MVSSLSAGIGRFAAVTAAAVSVCAAVVSPAYAVTFIGQDVPTTATIAPGTTGGVSWTYKNTGGSGSLPASGMSAVFTAPGNTTFAPQATVPSQFSLDGTSWQNNNVGLRNCALSNGNTTLTCEGYGINGGTSGWPAGVYFRFTPQVTVAASAPTGTALPPGKGTFSYTDPGGTHYTISDGTLNVSTPSSASGSRAMCLDIGNTRNNLDNARIWRCVGHTNQRFVIDEGQVKVADTIGTSREMCLDAGNTRKALDNVYIYACQTPNANQRWVLRDGQLVVKDTIGKSAEMCLDTGTTRNNNDNVFLYTCGSTNTNQKWVVQRGYIKVEDTLT